MIINLDNESMNIKIAHNEIINIKLRLLIILRLI